MPLVSVVLSTYNDAAFLRESVKSLLDQTFRDFELIVVDDGSTDNTAALLADFCDPRLRPLRNERNLGLAPSLNRGIAMARGKYIARQDADTISTPDRLLRQVEHLECYPDEIIVGSNIMATDENDNIKGVWTLPSRDIDIKWTLLFRTPLIHPTVLMRAAALDKAGSYSESAEFCCVEDYELWSRLCPTGTCANLRDPLMRVKCRRGGIGERHADLQQHQIERVSRCAMAAIIGSDDWKPDFWPIVQRFLYSPASEQGNLDASEAALAISALERLYCCFSRVYSFPERELRRHKKQVRTLWGRHCLGLGLKRSGTNNFRRRASLVAAGAGLLSKAAYLRVG
jgi:glycosyltransferase involved in cell wall biosynthesis